MNKKGQMSVGLIIGIFMTVIICIALFQGTFSDIGKSTLTYTYNGTITGPATSAYLDLTGQELLSTPTVYNSSMVNSTGAVGTADYTIAEGVSSVDGLKRIRYQTNAKGSNFTGRGITISYTYGAEGYADDSGSRSVIGLIAIFAALAIAMIALKPVLEERLM